MNAKRYAFAENVEDEILKINGKAEGFDPTCTSANGLFGREKILYIAMFGTRLPISKYHKELHAMTVGGAGSTDKLGKRGERMTLLEECIKCPALCEYFKLMTHYINGNHDYEQDLVVVWAGGNIITIFAKLLKNILDKCRNPETALDSINLTILTAPLYNAICACFVANPLLIEIVETVDKHPWSDLDCNLLPLFNNPDERAVLFNVYNLNLDPNPQAVPNIVFDLPNQPHAISTLDPLSHFNADSVSANENAFCHHAEQVLVHRLNQHFGLFNIKEDDSDEDDSDDDYEYEDEYDKFDTDTRRKPIANNNDVAVNAGDIFVEELGGGYNKKIKKNKITGGKNPEKMMGFALIRGKTEKECKLKKNQFTNQITTDERFFNFYMQNCKRMNSNHSICEGILKGLGGALGLDIKLFSAGAEQAHLILIIANIEGYLNGINPGSPENAQLRETCINYYKCLLIKKELNAALTKDHIKYLVQWCVTHGYKKSVNKKTKIKDRPRTELYAFVEYLKDTMFEINTKLGLLLSSYQPQISKTVLVSNFKSLFYIFRPLKNTDDADIITVERKGKCGQNDVIISLASLTAKVLFFYYTNSRTKTISDYINAQFRENGVSFRSGVFDGGMEIILSVVPQNDDKENYKNITSINGQTQCLNYNETDSVYCEEINEKIKTISQSLRIWFEDFHKRYYNWGWNEDGIRGRAPEARNQRIEYFDNSAKLSVKFTPNSVALPGENAEDDPDGAEFDSCNLSLEKPSGDNNVICPPINETDAAGNPIQETCCDFLSDVVVQEKQEEQSCATGGSKIKNIRKTNKKLKPQKRKTKRTNPRKTKQRKQPKQKISKKRSRK